MTVYEERMQLSHYRELYPLKEDGTVQLVRDDRTGELFVKKTLDVCRRDVCLSLAAQPVPGMPRIFSVAQLGEKTVLIEEYVNGRTLQNLLDERHMLPPEYALSVFRSVAQTVQALHSRTPAVIHRDIKPDNIILGSNGRVYLTDVDAAKPFEPGAARDTVLFGTAGYAAPEQYGFGGSGAQTDIYALGVLLNVMVTGALPAEMHAVGRIGKAVEKATRMDPRQRYASAEEFLSDVFGGEATVRIRRLRRFLPPGMRGRDPVKIIFAALGYVFLIWLSATLEFENASTVFSLTLDRIGFFVGVLLAILFCGDYLGVRTAHLLKNIKNRFLHAVLTVLIGVFLFIMPVLLCSMFE